MSYKSFQEALRVARQCEYYTTRGELTNEVVSKAEELFGQKFSRQNYEFYMKTGYLSFSANEFYGICKDDFTGTHAGCAIEATLLDRSKYNLPGKWLTIFCFDDGYYGYLDYSQLNEDNEPPVIRAIYNGDEYIVAEKVADDLGDFLLMCVEEQLSRQ